MDVNSLKCRLRLKSSLGGLWAFLLLNSLILTSFFPLGDKAYSEERFADTEIRVIRPKYFNKRKRFELGAEFTTVMNETFIYTFLGTGLATYHFTESIALEGAFGLAGSIDKEDKRILFEEFEIKTKIFRTQFIGWGSILWTPVYGKWQLPSGRLIYFDTFLSFGGGLTNIDWQYSDFCPPPNPENPNAKPLPEDQQVSYQTLIFGLGQRYFISKDSSIRWDIRGHAIFYSKEDAECDPEGAETGTGLHNNITLSLGMSRFL